MAVCVFVDVYVYVGVGGGAIKDPSKIYQKTRFLSIWWCWLNLSWDVGSRYIFLEIAACI